MSTNYPELFYYLSTLIWYIPRLFKTQSKSTVTYNIYISFMIRPVYLIFKQEKKYQDFRQPTKHLNNARL